MKFLQEVLTLLAIQLFILTIMSIGAWLVIYLFTL